MLSRSKSLDSIYKPNLILDNPFYSDLSSLMNDTNFQKINQNYFQRWTDIEVFIIYVKLYEAIQRIFPNLKRDKILSMIHVLMTHSDTRRTLIEVFENFKKDEESFLGILTKFIKKESIRIPKRFKHLEFEDENIK